MLASSWPANFNVASALLFVIMCAALPASIHACSSSSPQLCTTCSACRGNGWWYSSIGFSCGSGSGICAAFGTLSQIPDADTNGRCNYYTGATGPGTCSSCDLIMGSCTPSAARCVTCTRSGQIYAWPRSDSSWYNAPNGICFPSSNDVPCDWRYTFSCDTNDVSRTQPISAPICTTPFRSGPGSPPGEIIAILVIIPLLWLINMIAIGFFAHRKGMNGAQIAVFVTVALFVGVFAWICVALDTTQKTTIVVSDGIPLTPYAGSPSQNPYYSNAPNPDAMHAPQPYGQPPAPYPQDPNAPRPYSQPPAPYPAANQDPYAGSYPAAPNGQPNHNPAPHITPYPGPQSPENANL